MEVILDRLSLSEFFSNDGVVVMEDGKTINKYIDMCIESGDMWSKLRKIKEAKIGIKKYKYNETDCCFMYIDPRADKDDPYGIPNCNFTTIDEKDERWEEFKEQRKERGFDDSEICDLYYTISRFIYPRLKAFYDDGKITSYPYNCDSEEEWREDLKKMLFSFECIIKDKVMWTGGRLEEGLDLFRKYFLGLWN